MRHPHVAAAACNNNAAGLLRVVQAPCTALLARPTTLLLQHINQYSSRPALLPCQACYVWYNEMYKCYSQKGQDDEQCKKIKKDVR